MSETNRRSFLKTTMAASAASVVAANAANASTQASRPTNQTYMGDFIAPKLKTIKVAFIGCGARGGTHYHHLSSFEGTDVVAICDLYKDRCENAKRRVLANGKGRHTNVKLYHGGKHDYKKMLKETKPDLVYISTPWEWHAPMAIDAMEAGAHAAVEVPLCVSIKECWEIVNTSERTQKHCMMLENCNYGREEMLYLNMCRQGVFGELLHAEAAYIHELRFQMHDVHRGRGTGHWRTHHWAKENGNLYPTHGLGPVAQYMNLARGEDNFRRLVSFSTPARNHALYAEKHLTKHSEFDNMKFEGGDLNTSIIKTTLGRTVMVQWDESSPRPYSRHNLIQGTRGTAKGFPTGIALDYQRGEGKLPEKVFNLLAGGKDKNQTNFHGWSTKEAIAAIYEAYDHPLFQRLEEIGKRLGGHGGMDALMNYRVVECIQKGQPLDQNVYEGAFWSAVTPLTRKSVAEDGMPQDFPDFTRGNWRITKPLSIIH